MDSLTEDIYDRAMHILIEVEEEGGGGDEVHQIR